MAKFTIYRSSDASAPTLNGTVNSLRALLKACLVDGYGAKSAAGWTEDYTGTDKAAYRAPSGNRLYFRVQDDSGGTGGAKEALIRGFETMSDVDTGTGPFPTAAQSALTSSSVVARKSATADATARDWIIVADARTVYGFVKTGDNASVYMAFAFGEFYSFLPGDAYNSLCIGRNAENSAVITNERLDNIGLQTTASTFNFMARGYTQLGTSVIMCKSGDGQRSNNSGTLIGNLTFPNPSDGGIWLSPVTIADNTTAPAPNQRGYLRGIWQFLHPLASVNDADTFSGTGDLAGKTFLFIKQTGNSGIFTIETSDTLPTN
jgi:hypothetical protein